jgi:hypothetical protein
MGCMKETRSRIAPLRRAAIASGLAALSLWPAMARAQDDDHQRAVRAFTSARADIDNGNCRSAIPKLEESLAYEPSVGAHLSMADCYEQMDLLAAWRELKEAAAFATARNDERATVARDRASGLESRLATIKLVLPADAIEAANIELRLDGNLVKPFLYLGGIIATTRGGHDVEVIAPHKKTWRQHVAIQTTGTPVPVVVSLEDGEAPEDTPAPAPPAAGPQRPGEAAPGLAASPEQHPLPLLRDEGSREGEVQRTVGIAIGGVGVAGLVLGTVSGIVALSKNAQVRDACGGNVSQCNAMRGSSDVTGPRDAAESAATMSTVGFVLGGALVASGAAVYFFAPSSHRAPSSPHGAPAPQETPAPETPHETPAPNDPLAPGDTHAAREPGYAVGREVAAHGTIRIAPLLGDRVFGLTIRCDL